MGSSLHVHTIIEECPASRSSSFFFLLLLFFQLVVDVDQFISDERPPSCHVHRFAFEKIGMPAIPITDGLNVLTSLSILPQWKYIPLVYRYQHQCLYAIDVCIPYFFLQFFILYNLERRKKRRFSCPATTNEWKRNDARGRKGLCRQMTQDFRRSLCVCVYLLVYAVGTCTNVFIQRCVCVLCVYIFIYTGGGGRERTELRKAGHRTEKNNNSSSSSKRSDYLSNTKK